MPFGLTAPASTLLPSLGGSATGLSSRIDNSPHAQSFRSTLRLEATKPGSHPTDIRKPRESAVADDIAARDSRRREQLADDAPIDRDHESDADEQSASDALTTPANPSYQDEVDASESLDDAASPTNQNSDPAATAPESGQSAQTQPTAGRAAQNSTVLNLAQSQSASGAQGVPSATGAGVITFDTTALTDTAAARPSISVERPSSDTTAQATKDSRTSPVIAANQSAQQADGSALQQHDAPTGKKAASRTSDNRSNQNAANVSMSADGDPDSSPAAARAAQVDAAVRLENLSGSSASANAEHVGRTITVATQPTHNGAHGGGAGAAGLFTLAQFSGDLEQTGDDQTANNTPRIIRGLSAMLNQRGGVMNMRLDPPELGQIRIQMSVLHGVVAADFQAGTPQAHALLEKSLAALRGALEAHGLIVDRLSVYTMPANGMQFMRDDSGNNSTSDDRSHRHNHDAAGRESRGRNDHRNREYPMIYTAADFDSIFEGSPKPVPAGAD